MAKRLYPCRHCGEWVNPEYGSVAPAEHSGQHFGTKDDPKAPGDHTDCCDDCCYGEERCRNHDEPTPDCDDEDGPGAITRIRDIEG